MSDFLKLNKSELEAEYNAALKAYETYKAKGLHLDMSRGKPGSQQLDLSMGLLNALNANSDIKTADGTDTRNYGIMDGIPEAKKLFADILGVSSENVFVGGNSSLNMMFDTIAALNELGCNDQPAWNRQDKIKWLCPVPGYDRHFGITEYFGFEMINIPMSADGPNMDMIESLVANDATIKGMWCVPKYSNPQGYTYSDETVRRIAALKPAAKDFCVMWDNAYCIHDVTDTPDTLLNIFDEVKKTGNENMIFEFCSTSKITFPGAGVAAMAASKANLDLLKKRYKYQTIGYDKLNMLRHVRYFKDLDGVRTHMQQHKAVLEPRFNSVIKCLKTELGDKNIAVWTQPNGGYFISVDVLDGCAKRVVTLCKEAGVVLTGAGATYPYGKDPKDSNIRIAPTYPPVDELELAMEIFCVCTRLAAAEKLLQK